MFKIEVDVNGTIHGRYWMNKHEDDFLQFLPAQFSREYGEVITKDELDVYRFGEEFKPVLEGKIDAHEKNCLDESAIGKLRVCRIDEARLEPGHYTLGFFNQIKADRESVFSDAAIPQTVSVPATVQHDFGNGDEDAVELLAGHDLCESHSSLEYEVTGTQIGWPYNEQNEFQEATQTGE